MISASHNPAEDNGIKLFYRDGYKLSDELESRIEYEVFNSNGNRKFPIGGHVGKAFRIADALGRYIVFVKNVFPKNISLSGFNIHVDCANGAGYKAAPLIFEELGASVKSLGSKPNGRNINLNCGSLFPEGLRKSVRLGGADLGIALDGDADRVIFVDENGEEVDGDRILGLIALHMMSRSELKENTLVATIMSNIGLDNLMHSHGGSIIRTPVGDRYVIERMRQGGFNFGGEPSGHLIFLDNSTCGDGILGALHVLRIMLETGMPLSELLKDIPCYPQIKNDVPISIRPPLDEIPELVSAIKDSERKLSNNGRILVRYSGTQSVCRIQAEGDDPDHLKEIVELLSGIVEKYTNEQERKL
jgi:phosphoglucosamine mutase